MEISCVVGYQIGITAKLASIREVAALVSIQTPVKSPDCLLGVVPQLTDSRLKGTKREILSAMHVKELIQSNHSER